LKRVASAKKAGNALVLGADLAGSGTA
jgi:hypothetical protein